MMCALLLRAKDKNKIEEEAAKKSINPLHYLVIITDKTVKFLINEYRRIFNLMFRHPKITLLIAVAALFSLRLIMPFIGNDFFAKYDKDEIDISLTMPQGSTIDKTLETMGLIEEKVATIPEVKSYLTKIGDNGVENAEMIVKLTPSRERQRSDKDIISSLVGFGSSLPDAEIHMMSPGTGLSNADITINVFGKDYDKLVKLTQDMKERMEQSGYFRSVSNSYKLPKKEIQFIPNQESLMKYDVQNSYIGYILRASVYGDDSNIYKEQGEEYDINVELSDKYTEDFQDLEQINIVSRKGLLPITEFGDLKITKALPTIRHRDGERVIQLEGYLSKSSSGQVSNILDNEFKSLLSEGYNYKYAGDAELSEESTQEISKAFILAVLLTYMLLCALMNSFLRPFAIILSVAVSFVGVFYAVFFMEQTINIVAMLAMVMLVGLVVNNSILLLDYTVLKLDEGLPVKEALWRGAEVKFKAILMTTIAIIGGVLPQLWSIDPKKASMGAVIIGGMVASFLFTFIFTPVVFWYLEKMVHFFTKKKV
jgi:HAE1 family hydrophobic/amphiphilic exporter-1